MGGKPSTDQTHKLKMQSALEIVGWWAPTEQKASGTCFAVRGFGLKQNCVITAAHLLDPPSSDAGDITDIVLQVDGHEFHVEAPAPGYDYAFHPDWSYAPARACDMVLIQFSHPSDRGVHLHTLMKARACELAPEPPVVGEVLNVLRWDRQEAGRMMMGGRDGCMIAHACTAPGFSGGPWLNAKGRVVAVHAGAYAYVGQDNLQYSTAARGVPLGRRLLRGMLEDLLED